MSTEDARDTIEGIETGDGDDISTELFRRFELFRGLTDDELDRIAGLVTYCVYDSGEIVVEEGARSRALFILLEGQVDVIKKDEGADRHLATLGRDAIFGELGLVLGEPRTATVEASKRVDLLRLDGEKFTSLRGEHDLAAYKIEHNILTMLAERQASMNQELMSLMERADGEGDGSDEITELRENLMNEWAF